MTERASLPHLGKFTFFDVKSRGTSYGMSFDSDGVIDNFYKIEAEKQVPINFPTLDFYKNKQSNALSAVLKIVH